MSDEKNPYEAQHGNPPQPHAQSHQVQAQAQTHQAKPAPKAQTHSGPQHRPQPHEPNPPSHPYGEHRPSRAGVSVGILAIVIILAAAIIVLCTKVHHRNVEVAGLQKQLADAKSQSNKTQTDLDKANSTVDDLKTQLKKATETQADLKAQVEQASVGTTQLQSQIDREKGQEADLQSRLDKSETQSAAYKTQLDDATAASARMLSDLDQSKIQVLDLQGRLQKAENDLAQLQPMLLKARHMPVSTSFERTHGERFTLHVNNLTSQPVTLNMTINDDGKTRNQSSVLGASASATVEKLREGDTITIASDGFDPLHLTAQ
jgi:hypothetical protein